MKHNIGIMQGRLVPPVGGELQAFPRGNWADEFANAAQAGLDCIEWIFDLGTEDENPIWTDGGDETLRGLIDGNGVALRSVCADYFMRCPLLHADAPEMSRRRDVLFRLIERAALVGAGRIVVPFVDASSIRSEQDSEAAVEHLRAGATEAAARGMELHLETDFGPTDFADFLDLVDRPNIRVNYDSGNSASLGFAPAEELAAYGDRLGSVHIKDRKLGGGSVPLGQGDTDFAALFGALRRLDYAGDFILQAARGVPGDEVAWARANRAFIEGWVSA
jgi:hexulose-6-phosphate isomerase